MSKKLESTLKNMILSLLLISAVMAAALGFVYSVTKEPIEKANKAKEIQAIKEVLPAFNNDPTLEVKVIEGLTFYPASKDGKNVGVAVKTYTEKAFSGRFDMMVGFNPDGSIHNTVVLDQKETPGLGTKMKEPKFKDQFNNLNIGTLNRKEVKVKKDGGSIDAITAATITSRAFCDGVQKSYLLYMKNFKSQDTDSVPMKDGGAR
ncbi:MAG: RnfABCDGE type electron transport complex subunit G [Bacteroidales bacterium]|nr:RnfABCDGE type electron transport complex subunit G [Bacteroidales bacterium]